MIYQSSGNRLVDLRFLDSGGSVIDQAEYDYASLDLRAYTSFNEARDTGQTRIQNMVYGYLIQMQMILVVHSLYI